MTDIYTDATILVTGGTGSIGSAVVDELLTHSPRSIRILSRNEEKQFWAKRSLQGRPVRLCLGDVRSMERMMEAAHAVDFVFHCAALKHVSLCQDNPLEATQINAEGTWNVMVAAARAGARRLMHLSTDKVASPSCAMAYSKGLAEQMARSFNDHHLFPEVVTVRLGNVVDSSGSLGQIIRDCVARNVPYPLTDPTMTRFFISRQDAARFIVRALAEGQSGEVWIPEMPCFSVGDMANRMAARAASDLGADYAPDNYHLVGAQSHENHDEALWTEAEAAALQHRDGAHILPRN